jgi:hypothetical protein
MELVKKVLDCACYSLEHMVVFSYHKSENDFVYLSFPLNNYLPWYKRVSIGLRYIFGLQTQDNHFDTSVLDAKEVASLTDFLTKFQNHEDITDEI